METLSIRQLTFDRHPLTQDRMVLVALSNGPTYIVQDAGGQPHYNLVGGVLTRDYFDANPEVLPLLQAVAGAYQYWLAGHEDPLVLLLRRDSPALHELYEDTVDHDGSGPKDAPTGDDGLAYFAASPAERAQAVDRLRAFVANQPDAEHSLEAAVFRRGNKRARKCLENFMAGDHPEVVFSTVEYAELWGAAELLGWDPRAPLTAADSLRAWLRVHSGYQYNALQASGINRAMLDRYLAGQSMDQAGITPQQLSAIVKCAGSWGWKKPEEK